MLVSSTDCRRKEEQDGRKGQLSPSTSEIKNQYVYAIDFFTKSPALSNSKE
jgi:hypothetical protein